MDASTLPERLRSKFFVTPDCWPWTACVTNGYGQVRFEGRRWRAHRLVYTLLVGPIPDGMELDHECRQPLCVRPSHLEPVTTAENAKRRGAAVTECRKGRTYTPENTFVDKRGYKDCVTCRAERSRAYEAVRPSRKRVAA